jgi:hypothetical protein
LERGEKIGFILIVLLSVIFPFLVVESFLEIPSLVVPLFLWYPGSIGLWFLSEKNFGVIFLACYGAGNIGIVSVYYGVGLVELLFRTLAKILRRENGSHLSGYLFYRKARYAFKSAKARIPRPRRSKRNQFADWLNGKNSLVLILLVYLVPFPWSDAIATAAMRLKSQRYGIWYLFAVNLPHVFLIVLAYYQGLDFIFK